MNILSSSSTHFEDLVCETLIVLWGFHDGRERGASTVLAYHWRLQIQVLSESGLPVVGALVVTWNFDSFARLPGHVSLNESLLESVVFLIGQ